MSQFASVEFRAFLLPRVNGARATDQRNGSSAAIVYKAASAIFSFMLVEMVDGVRQAIDPGNISEINLLILSGTTPAVQKTVYPSAINGGATITEFEQGLSQHVQFLLSDSDTNLSAGSYTVIVWGYTSQLPASKEVFGRCDVTVEDVGFTAADPADVILPTVEQKLLAFIESRMPKVGANGELLTLVSANGLYRIQLGVDDAGNLTTNLVQ